MLALFNRARNKRANGEDGFTLIELLVVVVILGILIAIAIPVYLNYRKSAYDKSAQSDLRGAISTLEVCNSDGSYPSVVTLDNTATMTGCGSGTGTLKMSQGTTVTAYTTTGTPISSYVMATKNGGGTKWYCYNSANGGQIASLATAPTAGTCTAS